MAQRTVNGLFLDMQGDVVKALPVVVTQIGGFVGPDALRVRQVKHFKTTEAGLLSASLYVGGQYEVQYGGERFVFTLPAGVGALTWSEARVLGVPATPLLSDTISELIERRIAELDSTPFPGYLDYEAGTVAALTKLIDRKAERSELGDPTVDLSVWFENQLA